MENENLEPTSTIQSLEHIWKYSLGIIKDIFKLFILEVKLAGRSLATILILVVIASLLLLSSWFCLLGALTIWIMSFNLSLVASLFIMSAINLLIVIAIVFSILQLSNNLHFRETRKQLEFNK